VKTLAGLALAPEHLRGHGALYGALNQGRIEVTLLRRVLAQGVLQNLILIVDDHVLWDAGI